MNNAAHFLERAALIRNVRIEISTTNATRTQNSIAGDSHTICRPCQRKQLCQSRTIVLWKVCQSRTTVLWKVSNAKWVSCQRSEYKYWKTDPSDSILADDQIEQLADVNLL